MGYCVCMYASVKHKLSAFVCIRLIQNNNLLSVAYDITRHLHSPLLPVCCSTYLLPLLSQSLSPRLVVLNHWLDENRPPHFFFFMLPQPSSFRVASFHIGPSTGPRSPLEIARRSAQMLLLRLRALDVISLFLSQAPEVSELCPCRLPVSDNRIEVRRSNPWWLDLIGQPVAARQKNVQQRKPQKNKKIKKTKKTQSWTSRNSPQMSGEA